MFNLTGSEITMILLIALVVLGPEKLPDAVRRFMQTYNELKKMGNGFQSEIKAAFDEPMREMRDTAKMVMDSADPSNLMAEADAERRIRQDADDAIAAEPMVSPPATVDWAAPSKAVCDPGYDVVATPGNAPDPAHAPPPPPSPPAPPPASPPASPPADRVPPAERPAVGLADSDRAVAP